ncbi:MAG: DUF1552 domain-containing protein [Verrucomicrobia bacterium]|nr:DUF1552 domain-containing protein [Verrucomicrobiota bacterium]
MNPIERRKFLRGLGAVVALPALECFGAPKALAEPGPGRTASGAPLRAAFIYKPNGVNLSDWEIQDANGEYAMSPILQGLSDLRQDIQIIKGLEQKAGWSMGDGGGDHARANATFLTGVRAYKTAGADIKVGVSVDQLMAQLVADQTRFASLELGTESVRRSGVCDSGYSCAYQFNVSWRSETQPMAPEANPRQVFERLFGVGQGEQRKANLERARIRQRSLLDFVLTDAKKMHAELGRNDQQKLDEYLTGIREIERRIQNLEKFGLPPDPGVPAPKGVPESYEEHLQVMFDMMYLAFVTDSTRVISFLQSHDGNNRTMPSIGITQGHHTISHHQGKPEELAKLTKIDQFYIRQFAYFLKKLKGARDVDGRTLLENSMILWGSGLGDPDRHQHDRLPIIVAGNGGGRLHPGRHVVLTDQKTPLNRLHLRLLREMGGREEAFADAVQPLGEV